MGCDCQLVIKENDDDDDDGNWAVIIKNKVVVKLAPASGDINRDILMNSKLWLFLIMSKKSHKAVFYTMTDTVTSHTRSAGMVDDWTWRQA